MIFMRWEGWKMGAVEITIIVLAFVALGGCFVYSIIANGQK